MANVAQYYESYDIPKGTLRGAPPIPSDDLTSLRVSIFLVANKSVDADAITDLTQSLVDVRRAGEIEAAERTRATGATARPRRGRMPELVVSRAFLWVLQRLVSLVDFLEPMLGGFVIGIAIRMIFLRQPAKRRFQISIGRTSADPAREWRARGCYLAQLRCAG